MPVTRSFSAAFAIMLVALFAQPALAQRMFDEDGEQDQRNVAGVFDYYALVMGWSPTYCSERESGGYEPQCDRNDGRRYSFVLHGLWPQHERGFPGNCRTRRKPFVPQGVIDNMLDIMPSPSLIIHEYRKHGTCSGLDPASYYDLARKLFKSIKLPQRYANPMENQFSEVADIERDFLEVNPELRPDMFAVVCGGAGNRLKELRICMSKDGKPRACGANEDQRRLCSSQRKILLPPVRSSKIGPDTAEDREKMKVSPANRPRVIESLR